MKQCSIIIGMSKINKPSIKKHCEILQMSDLCMILWCSSQFYRLYR